jgi:2-keto-4-pentenoate hydratase
LQRNRCDCSAIGLGSPRSRCIERRRDQDGVVDHDAIATELLDAADSAALIELITKRWPDFEMDDAYAVLDRIAAKRRELGWRTVGRKIGFTNTSLWPIFGVDAPMWAPVWDRTLHVADGGRAAMSLDGLVQARIEPEVVLRTRSPLTATEDPAAALAAVDAIAPGFEVVQCHYAGWRFQLPDSTASFGLHARLMIGDWIPVDDSMLDRLATFEAVLHRNGEEIARGTGANVLGSPAHALAHLTRVVRTPIEAGRSSRRGRSPTPCRSHPERRGGATTRRSASRASSSHSRSASERRIADRHQAATPATEV